MTVLRMAMRTTPIPVTVGTFQARPKVTTVTRMKALRHPNDDNYEDCDPERDPCDCWHF